MPIHSLEPTNYKSQQTKGGVDNFTVFICVNTSSPKFTICKFGSFYWQQTPCSLNQYLVDYLICLTFGSGFLHFLQSRNLWVWFFWKKSDSKNFQIWSFDANFRNKRTSGSSSLIQFSESKNLQLWCLQ
jgi:hypothetical protein